MRQRDFIKGIAGSATVWPLAVRAQQRTMPLVGFYSKGWLVLLVNRTRPTSEKD